MEKNIQFAEELHEIRLQKIVHKFVDFDGIARGEEIEKHVG